MSRPFAPLLAAMLLWVLSFLSVMPEARSAPEPEPEPVSAGEVVVGARIATGQHPRGVAIHPRREIAVVTNHRDDTVSILALPSGEILETLRVDHGPRGVAIDPERELAAIVLEGTHQLALLDLQACEVIGKVETGRGPRAVAIDPEAGVAITANRIDDTLSLIELDTRVRRATLGTGGNPLDIVIDPGMRQAWVALAADEMVAVIDLESEATIDRLAIGQRPAGIALGMAHRTVAIAVPEDDRVLLVDPDTREITADVAVAGRPKAIAIDDHDGHAYVTARTADTVAIIDLESAARIDPIGVGRQPEAIAVNGDSRSGVVANRVDNDVTLLELPDTIPPEIVIEYPPDHTLTNQPRIGIQGYVTRPAALAIDGESVVLDEEFRFSHSIDLSEGGNAIMLIAIDGAGNIGEKGLVVYLDTVPPPPPQAGLIEIGEAIEGEVTVSGAAGSVEGDSTVTIGNHRTGESVTVLADADGAFTAVIAGESGDAYSVHATDAAGNVGDPVEIASLPSAWPPDPAVIAPPLDPVVVTSMHDATAFLYTGDDPVQYEVAPGAIDPERAAVLRGTIRDRDGDPLPGVTVSVHRHPEFGHTLSRADGTFDLVVNGGGRLTVRHAGEGFLPAQRSVAVPRQDFARLPDVVMIGLDAEVTTIDLDDPAPVQIARGSSVSDADGERRATLLFHRGTGAELVLPDGSIQPLSTLEVRATEYTVGDAGPAAMPGELPPASGYTYAVELSVDEAIAVGASTVRFDRPVSSYVENFLDFPVGGIVPSGWYDDERAAWIPADNGRVIEVLSVTAGIAELDVDGSGVAAGSAALDALGITDDERRALAELYEPGQGLWRVPVTHFTPWDYNWPFGPPAGAEPPEVPLPETDSAIDEPECVPGSIIECENSTLGFSHPVAGTPFTLNWRSNRVPGYRAAYTLDIPLSGEVIPSGLRAIDVEISIAGTHVRKRYPAATGLTHAFVWDGKDVFGRHVQGARQATVRIGYVYDAVYHEPAALERSFSGFGSTPLTASSGRGEVTLWRVSTHALGLHDARSAGLGGWTLDVHHGHDPSGTLYRGDGTRRSAATAAAVIDTMAGDGTFGLAGDGGPATAARIGYPAGMALAPDGSLYIADGGFNPLSDTGNNRRVRRVGGDGIITTVAGGGSSLGDGGPATEAALAFPTAVATGPDGSLYIADSASSGDDSGIGHRIRRVDADGIITTVAGTGRPGFSGDGGPAVEARLDQPMGLAVAADGTVYVSDWMNCRVRRIDPDGIITTAVNEAGCDFSPFSPNGDGGPAAQAWVFAPAGLASAPDGSLYIADHVFGNRIRRVGPDGIITTVAGGGGAVGELADGIVATAAQLLNPVDVAVTTDGTLYLTEQGYNTVRRVTPDGTITTVAGNFERGDGGDGGPAVEASLATPIGVAVGADHGFHVSDRSGRVRRVSPPRNVVHDGSDRLVASPDGSLHHVFDASGRHQRTVDSITGAIRYRFEYDDHGYLAAIDDDHGNRVRIERDAAGEPLAIVAPDDRRTLLAVDAGGYLAAITNPAEETWSMTSTPEGRILARSDPRGQVARYDYGSDGRLIRATDPAGGRRSLSRNALADGHEVRLESAEGRVSRYRVEREAGDRLRTRARPDGTTESIRVDAGGGRVFLAGDGTTITIGEGPDPRYGMTAPMPHRVVTTTPGGRVSETVTERRVVPGDARGLPGPVELTETIARDGRVRTSHYTAEDRAWRHVSPAGREQVTMLDAAGRVARRTAAGLATVDHEYDARGRLARLVKARGTADERVHEFGHDAAGRLVTITDPLGHTLAFERDPAGRIVRETLADGREIGYGYDAGGNLVSITPPGRDAHRFVYTPVHLRQAYLPPEVPEDAGVTNYHYDLDRRLTRIDRPDDRSVTLDHDAGGRLSTVGLSRGMYHYQYHPETGRLERIVAPDGGTLELVRDGFLPLSETTTGVVNGTVSRAYDDSFRLRELAVNGTAIPFDHDDDDLRVTAGALVIARDGDSGLPVGTTLGAVTTERGYNVFAERVSETARFDGEPVAMFSHERDALGRITRTTRLIDGHGVTEEYAHDAAGRLVAVTRDGMTTTWDYDANGNRTHENGQLIAEYDAQDRLLTYREVEYAYTANGELARRTESGAVTTYEYDELGNLIRVALPADTVIEYVIDGRDRRIGRKVDGALVQGFLYRDQLHPVAELDADGEVVSRFVYGDDPRVPAYMIRGGATYRILSDPLGSPRLVIDTATGEIAQRIDYDVRGNIIDDTRPGFQPFGFAGGLQDPDTGLVRFGARDYDPATGRWTAKDPIRFRGGDPNLYAYALNDPVNLVDPDGRIVLNLVSGSVGAVLGAHRARQQGDSAVSGAFIGFLGSAMSGRMLSNLAMGFAGNLAMQSLNPCLDAFSWAEATAAGLLRHYDLGSRLPWQPNLLSPVEVFAHEGAAQMAESWMAGSVSNLF